MGLFAGHEMPDWLRLQAHDLRHWTSDKHHIVDDRPFGGGDGMVLKPEPIFAAVEDLTGVSRRADYPADNARCSAVASGSSVYAGTGAGSLPERFADGSDLRSLRGR